MSDESAEYAKGIATILTVEQRAKEIVEQYCSSQPIAIFCICGSTRFADFHSLMRWELERTGKALVWQINYLPSWYADYMNWEGQDHFGEKAGVKELLDNLHLRKIDRSDFVVVINVEHYIGKSTQAEIEYAHKVGKRVIYLLEKENSDE